MAQRKIRYAVVGLGWIAQESVLPAFANAVKNSELTALVSDDDVKLKELGDRYNVAHRYSYENYEKCLRSGHIDAVFICLPNSMHYEYVVLAARAGIQVLCEKPMAMTEEECFNMIEEAEAYGVKLMIAYRLHFEEGNLEVLELVKSGKLGDVRIFNSTFSMDVLPGNVRLEAELTGGTTYDIGIYCINAARTIFHAEPIQVSAFTTKGKDERFSEVDEMTAALLRFPGNRFATFICSFGGSPTSAYEVIGSKGSVRVDPAYQHKGDIKYKLKVGDKEQEKVFPDRDQFGPEILYFSNCIIENKNPEPSGVEGWADVRVIQALYRSAHEKKPIILKEFDKNQRPSIRQSIKRPKTHKPRLIHARAPTRD